LSCLIVPDCDRELGPVVHDRDAKYMPGMKVDPQRCKDCFRAARWGLTIPVQASRTRFLHRFVVEEIEFHGEALRDLVSGIERIVRIGAVAQSTASAAESVGAFALDRERQAIGISMVEVNPKVCGETINIARDRTEDAPRLKKMPPDEANGPPI